MAAKARAEETEKNREKNLSEARRIRQEENYKRHEAERKNLIEEIKLLDGAEQRSALGDALYPLVSNLQPTKAALILSMIMELDTGSLMGYLHDPPSIRTAVAESMKVIDAPPPSLESRLPSYTDSHPSSTPTALGDADPMPEGGHNNVETEI
jgi:hypothetical protein